MNLSLESLTLEDWPFSRARIAYGQGTRLQLEVVYSDHDRAPAPTQLRSAWQRRQRSRGIPLLVVVLHDGKAHVCGPSGEDPTVYPNLDAGQVERICQEALEQPSRQAALRALRDSLGSLEADGLPGLRNEGFLASHELAKGVPTRPDWNEARDKARSLLGHTGKDLLTSLGFAIKSLDSIADVLTTRDRKCALAILLTNQETPESGSERIPGTLSPVSYALARADEENLDWVVLLHGRKIRLYPVKIGVGVGRRGRTNTFLECHTGLLPDDQAGYLWLLFSADALRQEGTLVSILKDSTDFAGDLASRLRERIYDEVIPRLAEGLAAARGLKNPSAQDLAATYEMSMVVLFRLLFIAYGEDKDLLPYRINGNRLYQKRSLKAKAKDLLELTAGDTAFGEGDTWWREIQAIFSAIDKGNPSWGVPAYNGGLFSSGPNKSSLGVALENVSLPDTVFGPVLQHLLLVPTREGGLGPVDFRSLGVREFGTVYEGLLESELSLAETDLTVEKRGKYKDSYRPCIQGEDPVVPKGKVYLHNASGARKSSGSYYTKAFAVEHLLDRALEPALKDHFKRLDTLKDLEAAEAFFDFRVADIAMGSGHFLVAAVDRIEAGFSRYLANRPLPQLALELDYLRKAAMDALGDASASYPDFEDNALLRRLIARRCIYGVDVNAVAVQLARLSIWIHTFVPGLPLSLLDRNLVHGNSLVGIAQLSEFVDALRTRGMPLFQIDTQMFLGDASAALSRLGKIADATKAELQEARTAWQEADAATAPTKALCDMLTASRIEGTPFPVVLTDWKKQRESVVGSNDHKHALGVLEGVRPLHFPIAFPEVFLRERTGFDVLIGNPPWKKPKVEEHAFWARHAPGLRGLTPRDQTIRTAQLRADRPDLLESYQVEVAIASTLRRTLTSGPFPEMGTGDPDLYKAFSWRFWELVTQQSGRLGVVLPRSALVAAGSTAFRHKIFSSAAHVNAAILSNQGCWIFDMDNRKDIALLSLERTQKARTTVSFSGPFKSRAEWDENSQANTASVSGHEVLSWSDSASLPLLPSAYSMNVFNQLKAAPRLDLDDPKQWRARPYRELDATNDKGLMDMRSESCPDRHWPVYKGNSFDFWNPSTGNRRAWADPDVVFPVLHNKRRRGNALSASVFYECDTAWCTDPQTHPAYFPRIAFRDVGNRTNKRTVRCALVPPNVFLDHKAPYFLFPRGSKADEAFLLGVLSSIPLDWYARRFVLTNVTFFVLNSFPVPRPHPDDPLRDRVVTIAGRLASVDPRFASWSTEIGVKCGPVAADDKQDMIHELDAVVAHLYGLTQDHLSHIFETFHVGWQYRDHLDQTLRHYHAWGLKA